MPMRKKKTDTEELTSKEEEVMRIFWENGPLFVKEMVDHFPEPKPHVNTVSTFVRQLEQKGFVGHEQVGGSFRYFASIPKEKYRKKTLGSVLRNYFNNSCIGMVSALVEDKELTVDELKDLIDIIESKQQEGGTNG